MWQVYLIYSKKLKKSYVGCSQNVEERLKKHNSGRVKSTKNGRPWILVYKEIVGNYQQARKKERYYKTSAGRKKLKQIFENFWRGARVV